MVRKSLISISIIAALHVQQALSHLKDAEISAFLQSSRQPEESLVQKASKGKGKPQGKPKAAKKGDGGSSTERAHRRAMMQRFAAMEHRVEELERQLGNEPSDNDGTRLPTRMVADGSFVKLPALERLRFLEHKVTGGLNWLKDPLLHQQVQMQCKNMSDLGTDHHVCFDNWEKHHPPGSPSCVVYDLGIRANPEFGVEMMRKGCKVRAYDPSPMSKKWWNGEEQKWWNGKEDNKLWQEVKDAGEDRYSFVPMAAGGQDGPFRLFEYDWNQVSIVHAENDISKRAEGTIDKPPKEFQMEARTFATMLKEHGDKYVDMLKLDIEGSEFIFLEEMFDKYGCPPVGQLTVEWHHFNLDERYGSSPELNSLHNLLNSCGFKAFHNRDHWRTKPGEFMDADGMASSSNRVLPPVRITLTSYCKDCEI